MHLVEQHIIKPTDRRFGVIDAAAFAAKNLYNAANYQVRQSFIHEGVYDGFNASCAARCVQADTAHNSTSLNHTVGRRIAAARRSAQLTQAALATKLNWPRDTLIHYEYSRRAITINRIEQIAAALSIPAATLLMDDESLAAKKNHEAFS